VPKGGEAQVHGAGDLHRRVVTTVGHRELGIDDLAEQVRVNEVLARREPSACVDWPAGRDGRCVDHNPTVRGAHASAHAAVASMGGTSGVRGGDLRRGCVRCAPPHTTPGACRKDSTTMFDDHDPDGDRPIDVDADDVNVDIGLEHETDVDASVWMANSTVEGRLTMHFVSRDVTVRVDGATALQALAAWQRRSARRYVSDPYTEPATWSRLGIDLSQVLAISWSPTDDVDTDGPRVGVEPF
jgi:hypothetical protein